jgi:subtilase family serine protease
MGFPLSRRYVLKPALAVLSAVLLLAIPSYAGKQTSGAIPGEKAAAEPSGKAHFTCELRPFDLSKGLYCYGPDAIRAAYGVEGLLSNGFNGAGQTIVIIDAFGSPFAAADLKLFDSVFGLPDPSFTQIVMPGTPPFDPNNANIVGWTLEIALDTQWSHAMAPAANIVLVAAKSNNDQDLIDALNYALDHHLGSVVSMSFGESEFGLANPDGLDIVEAWTDAFQKAKKQRVTLFVSSGDNGVDTGGFGTQNVGFPASSPLVTAVGGTNLQFGTATNADPNGTYQAEEVWNDGFGAGGGGMSILFAQPDYQSDNVPRSINKTLHHYRGVPDVAYNAGVVGGVITAWAEPFGPGAFFLVGGTSAGAPQWSGIIADLNQARGRPAGFINRQLYKLGGCGQLVKLFHDIVTGDNSFNLVPGFPALPGYDLSTGFGTPNFDKLGMILSDQDDN